jgi:adenylate kinase
MGKMILLTGLPGIGKSSLTSKLLEIAHERGIPVTYTTYGTVMLDLALEKGIVSNRDEIRRLPLPVQKELQVMASKQIGEMKGRDGLVIVDTHMIVSTEQGWLPGISMNNLEDIAPDQIIVVEAEPEAVSKRRRKDKSRARDEETIEMIREEIFFSRYMAAACSVLTGSPVRIVVNREGKLEEAVHEILAVLEAMMK